MDHFNYQNGVLCAEDVPLTEIAKAVGTPVYVYSTATLTRHFRQTTTSSTRPTSSSGPQTFVTIMLTKKFSNSRPHSSGVCCLIRRLLQTTPTPTP